MHPNREVKCYGQVRAFEEVTLRCPCCDTELAKGTHRVVIECTEVVGENVIGTYALSAPSGKVECQQCGHEVRIFLVFEEAEQASMALESWLDTGTFDALVEVCPETGLILDEED